MQSCTQDVVKLQANDKEIATEKSGMPFQFLELVCYGEQYSSLVNARNSR